MIRTFQIHGPHHGTYEVWRATATIVQLLDLGPYPQAAAGHSDARRTLFLDQQPLSTWGPRRTMLPGTMVARFAISTVNARIGSRTATWTLARGHRCEVDLVVSMDPQEWIELETRPVDVTLIAGDIPLDGLTSPDCPAELSEDLIALASWRATSSGLSVTASVRLPWQRQVTIERVPLLAGLRHPAPVGAHVALDLERFTAQTLDAFRTAYAALGTALGQARSQFVTLELAGERPPGCSWSIMGRPRPERDLVSFRFSDGELRLVIGEAPQGDLHVRGRGWLVGAPAVEISTSPADELVVTIKSPDFAPSARAAALSWSFVAATFAEKVELVGAPLVLEYDAIELSRRLRALHAIDPPTPTGETDHPILWGATPLDDGWAQLPFLNLTEQAYATTSEASPPGAPASGTSLRGAAMFGNAWSTFGPSDHGEQTWSATILGAAGWIGAWTLRSEGDTLAVVSATLRLETPELELAGFLWLATEPPTIADALPSHDDWVGGLADVPLRAVGQRRYSSPFVAELSKLSWTKRGTDGKVLSPPDLGTWQVRLVAGADYEALVRVLHATTDARPLVWRRHPRLPFVQALSLTQNQLPPRHPSPSRELFPFALSYDQSAVPRPHDWVLRGNGAQRWPSASAAAHDPSWERHGEQLAAASLAIGGLVAVPQASSPTEPLIAATEPFLSLQYRFGLPYTDEINALAQLPKDADMPVDSDGSPIARPAREPVPVAPPLRRDQYAAFWTSQAEKARLAETDLRDALASAGGTQVVGLIEPLVWPVHVTLASQWPPTLTFAGHTGSAMVLDEHGGWLRGFDGGFTAVGRELSHVERGGTFVVRAGAMDSIEGMPDGIAETMVRDQRGQWRGGPMRHPEGNVIRTRIALESANPRATRADVLQLCTAIAPIDLSAGSNGWKLWFRDLPVGAAGFARGAPSSTAEDINDPAATTRERIAREVYEWRLGAEGAERGERVALGLAGLDVFPLRLEGLQFAGDDVAEVRFLARLQLPSAEELPSARPHDPPSFLRPLEQPGLDNVVELVFRRAASGLNLARVALPEGHRGGVWPLTARGDGPRLVWEEIAWNAGTGLHLANVRLELAAFDAWWSFAIDEIAFSPDGVARVSTPHVPASAASPNAPVRWSAIELGLGLRGTQRGDHLLTTTLDVSWGDSHQPGIRATWEHTVVPPAGRGEGTVDVFVASGARRLSLSEATIVLDDAGGGLQVRWEGIDVKASPGAWQTLPGFRMVPGSLTGWAAVGFRPVVGHDGIATGFETQVAATEWLVRCDWEDEAPAPTTSGIRWSPRFSASIGDVYWNQIIELVNGVWETCTLLNGTVDVTNLVSWPDTRVHHDTTKRWEILGFADNESAIPESGHAVLAEIRAWLNETLAGGDDVAFYIESHIDARDESGVSSTRARLVREALEQLDAGFRGRAAIHGWAPSVIGERRRVEVRVAARVRIPGLHDARDRPMKHLRHTMRVLFNQHELPSTLLAPATGQGSGPLYLLREMGWQMLAVVEHDIDVLTLADHDFEVTAGSRWSLVQEVRWSSPDAIASHLRTLVQQDGEIHALATSGISYKLLPLVHAGLHHRSVIDALAGGADRGGALRELGSEALVVEASVVAWLRPRYAQPIAEPATALQYLPDGAQLATLTTRDALGSTDGDGWLLVALPFLGRVREASTAPDARLTLDPIWRLLLAREAQQHVDPLLFSLTSWSDQRATSVTLADFDSVAHRWWTRLDPDSVAEAWTRLQSATVEPDGVPCLAPAMQALAADSPGLLGRSAALLRAFDPRRPQFPPASSPLPELPAPKDIRWRPDSVLSWQAFSTPTSAYSLIGVGYWLGEVMRAMGEREQRWCPAVTLLPTPAAMGDHPVSLAISPYLAVPRAPRASQQRAEVKTVLAFGELLACERRDNKMRIVALASQMLAIADSTAALVAWAEETHAQLAPDSPIAVLRMRTVKIDAGGGASIAIDVQVLGIRRRRALAIPARALRADVAALAYLDGHYGGDRLPAPATDVERAGPVVGGVRSLDGDVSGLRFVARNATSPLVADGWSQHPARIWWTGVAHHVQFAPPDRIGHRPLPAAFRAPAILADLPRPPHLPLPEASSLAAPEATLQAVLPDQAAWTLLGARPGAPFTFHHHVIVQDGDDRVFASGGPPVQHRAPRPRPLPPNEGVDPSRCLQPWATRIRQNENHLRHDAPMDNAYFEGGATNPVRRVWIAVEVRLIGPDDAILTLDGTGELMLEFTLTGVVPSSAVTRAVEAACRLELSDGARSLQYQALWPFPPVEALSVRVAAAPLRQDDYRSFVRSATHGRTLTLRIALDSGVTAAAGATPVLGYRQQLELPMRVAKPDRPRLPHRPHTVIFEDPEYNRRLASVAAQVDSVVVLAHNEVRLTLAADRLQYNPTSTFVFALFPATELSPADLEGLSFALRRITRDDPGTVVKTFPEQPAGRVLPAHVYPVELAELSLQPGDKLEVVLRWNGEPTSLSLRVDIVAAPVIPSPDAAYALLRRDGEKVSCARFAWGPAATRIELTDPADLLGGTVRRRAVFRWTMIERPTTTVAYFVQKISASGASHLPNSAFKPK